MPSELVFCLAPFQLLTGFRDTYRGEMHADVMLNLSTRKTAAQQSRHADYVTQQWPDKKKSKFELSKADT